MTRKKTKAPPPQLVRQRRFPKSEADFSRQLGAQIQAVRIARGITRARFMRLTRFSTAESIRVEAGATNISAFKVALAARALGVSVDDLLPVAFIDHAEWKTLNDSELPDKVSLERCTSVARVLLRRAVKEQAAAKTAPRARAAGKKAKELLAALNTLKRRLEN